MEAAQQRASGLPYVKAVFGEYQGDRSRLRLTRHYTGAEAAGPAAVCGGADGSLIRARVDASTGTLYTSRVASPAAGSTFSGWTSQGTVSDVSGIALAARGSTVWLFYVHTDDLEIRLLISSDNGANWSASGGVLTAANAVGSIAAAWATAAELMVCWSEGTAGEVWSSRWTGGGGFDPQALWTNSAELITGLAVHWSLDWCVVVTGLEPVTLDAMVWTCYYGDGVEAADDDWSALVEVMRATVGTQVTFKSPALAFLAHWRLFFVESYGGDEAYDRVYYSTMQSTGLFSQDGWREPAPFNYEGTKGVAARAVGGSVWLATYAGVWSSASPAAADLTVSADVIEAVVDADEQGARVRLVLDNSDGGYSAYGSGALGSLRRGARLQLTPGYRTTAGAEIPTGEFGYWVESVELVSGARPRLVVQARDAWWLLELWRARRQFQWDAGELSVFQLLSFLAARAGLMISADDESAALTTVQPAFTISPGESGAAAVRRLLALVPDVVLMDSATLRVTEPDAAGSSDYDLGEGHAIVSEGHYEEPGPAVNFGRVAGAGVYGEAFDFDDLAGYERIEQAFDRRLTVAADATGRAEALVRDGAIHARRDEVRLFGVQCGQQIYDVVSVTDAGAGLDEELRRVLGCSWRYRTIERPVYDMTLVLGAR